MEIAKAAQKSWAKTPLWKRAELLHKAASILKQHKAPIAECLVKEIAKPAKDSVIEVFHLYVFLCKIISCFPKKNNKKNKVWVYYVVNFLWCFFFIFF